MVNGTEQERNSAGRGASTPHQYEVTGTGRSTASTYAGRGTSDEVTAVCNQCWRSTSAPHPKAKKYRVAA